jgi:hypothetical protein
MEAKTIVKVDDREIKLNAFGIVKIMDKNFLNEHGNTELTELVNNLSNIINGKLKGLENKTTETDLDLENDSDLENDLDLENDDLGGPSTLTTTPRPEGVSPSASPKAPKRSGERIVNNEENYRTN